MKIEVGKCYYFDGTYHKILEVGGSFVEVKCLRANPDHAWEVGGEGRIQRTSFERGYSPVKIEPGEIWRHKGAATGAYYYKKIKSVGDNIIYYYTCDGNMAINDKDVIMSTAHIFSNSLIWFIESHEYFGKVGKWCWLCGTACRRYEGIKLAFDGLCWSCYEV